MLKFLRVMLVLFAATSVMTAQTSLQGTISEDASGELIPFADVILYKNEVLITGTQTDFDGNYNFSNLDPGTYDVEVRFLGYATSRTTGVLVKAGSANYLNAVLQEEGELMDEVVITAYKVPLINIDETSSGNVVTAETIKNLPTKNITAIAGTTAGLSTIDGGDISVRGSRTNSTFYYVDGVRVSGDNINGLVPQSEIDQLQVITGGIEAKYGDVTGGVISITTKGPSQNFGGGFEVETSEFLDGYGYNLLSGNINGPILKNKDGQSILGFRLSAQYTNIADDDPSQFGNYRASEALINELTADPTYLITGTTLPSAERLTDLEIGDRVKRRPNETDIDYSFNGKIDARLSDNIDVSLSGSYFDSRDQFAPRGVDNNENVNGHAWALLNWVNNPTYYRSGYRGNFRFRHKLGRQGYDPDDQEANSALIQNANYTIQVGYEKNFQSTFDKRHEDNLFNYGYWGDQARSWEAVASQFTGDTSTYEGQIFVDFQGIPWTHQGYAEQLGEFTPNTTINPGLSLMHDQNGFEDPTLDDVWGLFNNVGAVYNRFYKREQDTYTVRVSSGFDIFPGSSSDGKHSVQFGFLGELRTNREWEMNPRRLWTLAQLRANQHIASVDLSNATGSFTQFLNPIDGEVEFTQYGTATQEDEFPDSYFFRRVREMTNQSLGEYVNVDGLDPSQLTLDMFSAGELNNFDQLNLNYFGYDYLGNKLTEDVTFNDFFSARDENGVRTFNVAPHQPIYAAGYLQDKFIYKDIIFRVGIRADYFDANARILKDPYSLYEIEEAGNFYDINSELTQPSSVEDSYKVYVDSEGSTNVVAYRDGDQWFFPNGSSASSGASIFGGGLVFPYYKDAENRILEINNPDFDPDVSFEDYTPQLNWMPRLAFSFPISEDAGFFAHYDVLVQRPPSNSVATALNYYYFENPIRFSSDDAAAGNPALRPERTIDYEVGFQQKVSASSAIKMSAYYKELRDMIQQRVYTNLPAPVNQYQTFGNLDFGTVKGFSFAYDLRRTGNIELGVNYTLQFADGSGSDANSSRGLSSRGVLRTLFPLSYDERHRIAGTIDYRYGSGKQYTGPTISNIPIFANTGLNAIVTAISGRPYSAYQTVDAALGESGLLNINGSRKPWVFNTDLKIDRQFNVKFNQESKRSLNINAYLRFENLFNTKNVVDVYRVTGDPADDGYLVSSFGQDQIRQIIEQGAEVESFLAAHSWRVLNPDYYTRPRRIYLGVLFNF